MISLSFVYSKFCYNQSDNNYYRFTEMMGFLSLNSLFHRHPDMFAPNMFAVAQKFNADGVVCSPPPPPPPPHTTRI